jgi:hypothetical protein
LQDAVCADEARAAGYKDEFVCHNLCVLDGWSWGRSQVLRWSEPFLRKARTDT